MTKFVYFGVSVSLLKLWELFLPIIYSYDIFFEQYLSPFLEIKIFYDLVLTVGVSYLDLFGWWFYFQLSSESVFLWTNSCAL